MPACGQRNFKRYYVDLLFLCLDFPFRFVCLLGACFVIYHACFKTRVKKCNLKANIHGSCCFLDLYH